MGVPSVGFRTTEAAERRFCLPEHNTFLCRCVRSPSKYGFQPSREGEGGFYGRWEKPWTFGDTPFKLLPLDRQPRSAAMRFISTTHASSQLLETALTSNCNGWSKPSHQPSSTSVLLHMHVWS